MNLTLPWQFAKFATMDCKICVWFLCAIGIVAASNLPFELLADFHETDISKPNSTGSVGLNTEIGRNVSVGWYVTIGRNVTIGAHSRIFYFVTVGNFSKIGANSIIFSRVNIGEHSTIGNNATIGYISKSGYRISIGSDSVVYGYVEGHDVKIGNRVKMNARVRQNVEIDDDCIIRMYSDIGTKAKIHRRVYIGESCEIQSDATVHESAVIHDEVVISKGATVERNQVIIKTPASEDLYKDCDWNLNASDPNIEIAANHIKENSSFEFNKVLRNLIDSQFNKLMSFCAQAISPAELEDMPYIKTLYLVRFHGFDRFNEIEQTIKYEDSFELINDHRPQLLNEHHFGKTSENILDEDVQKKFLQLLAIEQDIKRLDRIENDSVCIMIGQIRSGEREVVCGNRHPVQFYFDQ